LSLKPASFKDSSKFLELRLAKTARLPAAPPRRLHDRLAPFARAARPHLNQVEAQIAASSPAGRWAIWAIWAIWGAGAKGVALVNQLQLVQPVCVIPRSRVPAVAPHDRGVIGLELILIANPNYAGEITSVRKSLGYRGQLQILR
jgi:hypothetical protein